MLYLNRKPFANLFSGGKGYREMVAAAGVKA
jgi:hypothetical protein